MEFIRSLSSEQRKALILKKMKEKDIKVGSGVPNKIYNKVIKWAKLAHELLGCSGISRSDFRYDDSKDTLYMLEINTQPGMTKTSLSPEQAKYCGISLTELVEKLISKAKFEKV